MTNYVQLDMINEIIPCIYIHKNKRFSNMKSTEKLDFEHEIDNRKLDFIHGFHQAETQTHE